MNIQFDQSLALGYNSPSQIVRVLTETWVSNNVFCPHCGSPNIRHFPNNRAVADFYCPKCGQEYELKSQKRTIGNKIPDGAYDTFIQRITSNNNPDFFILGYDAKKWSVENLLLVPGHFFVPEIVEKRPPLPASAKRAGWVGCNILFSKIPRQGQVSIIKNHIPVPEATVISSVQKAALLKTNNLEHRGWLLETLNCIDSIPCDIFTLNQMYAFEGMFQNHHPQNHNVKAKIRQQLQILRDMGFLEFLGQGRYKKTM